MKINELEAHRKEMLGGFCRELAALVVVFPALEFWINGKGDFTANVAWVTLASVALGIGLLWKGVSLGLDSDLLKD